MSVVLFNFDDGFELRSFDALSPQDKLKAIELMKNLIDKGGG